MLRRVPSNQRRQIVTIFSSVTLSSILCWFLVGVALPPNHPEVWFLVYPLWALLQGHTCLALAPETGRFYIIGPAFYGVSVMMVFLLPVAPLIAGVLMFCNMTMQGVILLRTRARAGEDKSAAVSR